MKESESNTFNQNAYVKAYNKEKYKNFNMRLKPDIADKITAFCTDMGISKADFVAKCCLYIIDNNMIDDIRAYKPRED